MMPRCIAIHLLRSPWKALLLAALAPTLCLGAVGTTRAQDDQSRRENDTPGLLVDTGARTGPCDVLTFTADGNYLLAAGDDKVVRNWKLTPAGLETSDLPPLRWSIFRETRGNIYAMALSPEKGQPYVAIAGVSRYKSEFGVAILDRKTAKVLYGLKPNAYDQTQVGGTWSLAFSPSGSLVAFGTDRGDVWVWDFRRPGPTSLRLLGKHSPGDKGPEGGIYNDVKFVTFPAEDEVLSVAKSGEVKHWKLPAGGGRVASRVLFRLEGRPLNHVAMSPDGTCLAAVTDGRQVHVCSLPDGAPVREIKLAIDQVGNSLAFDAGGKRLAVGVLLLDQKADFYREVGDRVLIYDLRKRQDPPTEGPRPTFHAYALAFHPLDPNLLAIAGGNDEEVTVWDLRTGARRGEVVSPGNCLWGVGLSPDAQGRYLAFQPARDPQPVHPNRRGRGAWKVFDLRLRQWAPADTFVPRPAATERSGWKVLTSTPEHRDGDAWFVQGEGGKVFPLPWRRKDGFPRCYAFLPPAKGKPVRLAVGHYWGVSIFDLTAAGPRRSRLLSGHDAEVMALALSADGTKLVSAGRDQTIAGWSLADWPSHPTLGANFFQRGGKLMVGTVDTCSPVWETGLSEGDEILLLVVDRKIVFNRTDKHGPKVGSPATALAALRRPAPGLELYFGWKRPGEDKLVEQLTSVLERPLWRFFPTRGGEWVLWRWRDYYYDASTQGDWSVGWQRSFDIDRTPEFFRAEQFRARFNKPKKVGATLASWAESQELVHLAAIEPPRVALSEAKELPGGDVEVTLTAAPQGPLENQQTVRVALWINDFQFRTWEKGDLKLEGADRVFRQTVRVPAKELRRGRNVLIGQAYNKGGLRSQAPPVLVTVARPAARPDLYGLFAGVGDYRKSRPRQVDLRAAEDVEALKKAWEAQRGKLFEQAHFDLLRDEEVTRAAVLDKLAALAAKVRPDDLLIFELGGHGVGVEDLRAAKVPARDLQGLGSFLFACGDFNLKDLPGSTISVEEIYQKLVKLPCHKLILLDTCHAGRAREAIARVAKGQVVESPSDPVRELTQEGIGPIILAACGPHESAQEEATVDLEQAFSLFAVALRRTLEDEEVFVSADTNHDQSLGARELAEAVRNQVRALVRELRRQGVAGVEEQNPVSFINPLENNLAVARR
jgi:WD40 repeat protein